MGEVKEMLRMTNLDTYREYGEELEKRLTRLEARWESICHADEIVSVGGA